MYEERTKTPIDQVVIVIAVDESPQIFIEKRDDWILSTQKKIKLYEEYYDKIS